MTTDKHKFKKEIEASQYFMNKNAKSMFDVIDMCEYYQIEENAVRQPNRSEAGNFVNLLNQEIKELKNSMKKENKRYLNCKYLDAGMDGMLCSKNLCTTCKEFNGEKCKDYISKDKKKITKTTNWLTKGMTQEEIKKIKEEALREADKELAQIEEREKQCEYCKDHTLECLPIVSNCDPLFERFSAMIADMGNGGKEIVIITKGNAFGLPINYCPICGRKLK